MAATVARSAWRWPKALTVAVVLAASGVGSFARATSADAELRETLDGIYRESAVQRELPEGAPREPTARFAGSPYAFFALFAAVAVVLLAAWLVDANWDRLGERFSALHGIGRKARALRRLRRPPRRDWYREADMLAANGRCAEAIHLLLSAALAELAGRAPRWPNAATAREIAALPLAGGDLRTLVAAAELAHFGGREATQAQYHHCRACALAISLSCCDFGEDALAQGTHAADEQQQRHHPDRCP